MAPLPAGSRMPLSPNPPSVGREGDLKALAKPLNEGKTATLGQVRTAATTGLVGIGKTQLASTFVHRYGRFFAGVAAEIAACGGGKGAADSDDPDYVPIQEVSSG